MIFFLVGQDYDLYFDINYIINLIDRKFLFEIYSEIIVRKILSLIIVRGLSINIYDVNEYINLEMYILGKNSTDIILIKREFYIVDNLIAKALIDIDILKLEEIIFDII